MIKTNELMLGDLVRLPDGQIAKVVSLYKNHKGSGGEIIVDSDLKIFNSLVRDEDINPIPLTEEILFKNGFSQYIEWETEEEIFSCKLDNAYVFDVFMISKKPEEEYFDCLNIKLRYVHQLQQALRLHGLCDLANHLKI